MTFAFVLGWAGAAAAWPNWEDGCSSAACHGSFSDPYTSLSDGQPWAGSLHDVHQDMLNNDCDTCHPSSGFFPVSLSESAGGDGLAPISCAGCHSRAEPADEGNVSGVGLRQHHFTATAGSIDCLPCHSDANPANFTPIGEDLLPPYYANPGNNHPAITDDPCNPEASGFPENFAASTLGLDNDGDNLYDEADVIDCPEPAGVALQLAALAALGGAARMRGRHPR